MMVVMNTELHQLDIKKVLVTGATGLVGRAICRALVKQEMELVVLGRREEEVFRRDWNLPCKYYQWKNPAEVLPPREALEVDAVIHLMGEPLAGKRWNRERKKAFRSSRIDSTRNLVQSIREASAPVKVFVSASAIGIYGEGGDQSLTEESGVGDDYLASLCRDWEEEARKAPCRSVQCRLGLVLSPKGGALAEMVPIFKKGLGGPLANGRHWMSWIHIDDVVGAFLRALHDSNYHGPLNVVAPNPVRNREFTRTLARALNVMAVLPAPKIALKIALGEMAQVVLASQKVSPVKLMAQDYTFLHTDLEEALDSLY